MVAIRSGHEESHRISEHVIPQGVEISERNRTLGLERVLGNRSLVHDVRDKSDGRLEMLEGHGHRPPEPLRSDTRTNASAKHLRIFGDLGGGSRRSAF